jgi:putative RecB family exonuclease
MSIATKPHLSSTQLDTFCRCPEQWRRRYIEGDVIPPGIASAKGKGFHTGAETNMRQKIETYEDLPVSDIVELSVAAFEAQAHGGIAFTDDEHTRGPSIVIGEAKDSLRVLATVHAQQQAPDYQPILVEQTVRIELPNAPRDLLGIIDLADNLDRVTDFKTAGRKKNQADADDSVQLTTYAAAFHAHTGRQPSEVRLDSVIQTKTKTDRQVITSQRGGADFSALAHRINAVTRAIDAGNFTPTAPGSWWCSARWCGYWSTCKYVNSERKSLAERFEV